MKKVLHQDMSPFRLLTIKGPVTQEEIHKATILVMSRMQSPTNGLEQMTTVTQFNLKFVMYQNMVMLSYSREVANDIYYSI